MFCYDPLDDEAVDWSLDTQTDQTVVVGFHLIQGFIQGYCRDAGDMEILVEVEIGTHFDRNQRVNQHCYSRFIQKDQVHQIKVLRRRLIHPYLYHLVVLDHLHDGRFDEVLGRREGVVGNFRVEVFLVSSYDTSLMSTSSSFDGFSLSSSLHRFIQKHSIIGFLLSE